MSRKEENILIKEIANSDIRCAMKENKIPAWKIADIMKCHENTVYHQLRHELSPEDKKVFLDAINIIKKEINNDA